MSFATLLVLIFICFASKGLLAKSELSDNHSKLNCGVSEQTSKDPTMPFVMVGTKEILGTKISNLRAYAWRQKKWVAVKHQIDEKNSKEEYVLSDGLPFTKDTDDGYFDENDELVVIPYEMGDYFEQKNVPDNLKNNFRHWRLTLCTHEKNHIGSVLFVEELNNSASISPVKWPIKVNFDKSKDTIDTEYYRYFFNANHAALIGKVFLKEGDKFYPAFESSRFLMPLDTPWYLPSFEIEDVNFESEIESWQVGPIRTIVAVGVKYSRLFSLIKLHMFSELVFYESSFQIPSKLFFPLDSKRFLRPGSGLAYSIKFASGSDWQIDTNISPIPAKSPAWLVENALGMPKPKVYFAQGRHKELPFEFMAQLRVDPDSVAKYPPPLIARAGDFYNTKLQSYWPWLKKIPGDFGVYVDLSMVEKGEYDFGLDLTLKTGAYKQFVDYSTSIVYWHAFGSK